MGRSYPGRRASMNETTPEPGAASNVRAVLFDLDGTLVDSNYLHVTAWWEAFRETGHEVSCYDIHRALGLPSADLVQQLLGRPDDAVVEQHDARWERRRSTVLAFHGASQLVWACAERDLRVVWATSGSEADIEAYQQLLDVDDAVHAILGSADIEAGKPDPEVIRKGAAAAGVDPAQAVVVGDTTYDVRAAKAAGALAVGLLAGGIGRAELSDAGADLVLGNAQELLTSLDDVLAQLVGLAGQSRT